MRQIGCTRIHIQFRVWRRKPFYRYSAHNFVLVQLDRRTYSHRSPLRRKSSAKLISVEIAQELVWVAQSAHNSINEFKSCHSGGRDPDNRASDTRLRMSSEAIKLEATESYSCFIALIVLHSGGSVPVRLLPLRSLRVRMEAIKLEEQSRTIRTFSPASPTQAGASPPIYSHSNTSELATYLTIRAAMFP